MLCCVPSEDSIHATGIPLDVCQMCVARQGERQGRTVTPLVADNDGKERRIFVASRVVRAVDTCKVLTQFFPPFALPV